MIANVLLVVWVLALGWACYLYADWEGWLGGD
jgi:hypothetical protein